MVSRRTQPGGAAQPSYRYPDYRYPAQIGYGGGTVAASAGVGFAGGVMASGAAWLLPLLLLAALLGSAALGRWPWRWRRPSSARSTRVGSKLVVYEEQVLGTGCTGTLGDGVVPACWTI